MSEVCIRFRCQGCWQGVDIPLSYISRGADGLPLKELERECPNCVTMGNIPSILVRQKHVQIGPARNLGGREYELFVI